MVRETATIEAASFSRLDVYEQCAHRGYWQYCKKIPEPDRGLPHKRCPVNPATKQREWHNDRGTRLHDSMDKYVRGISDKYDIELKDFDVEMTNLRAAFEQELVYTEQMWCYKDDWIPTVWNDWDNTNMRIKLDAFQALEGTRDDPIEAVAIDLKSGKKFGNEVKHSTQLQLYALGAFKKYPNLELCHTEVWYSDFNDVKQVTYRRDQALNNQLDWDQRIEVMLSDTVFEARASEHNCKYCPYKHKEDGGTGHCDTPYRYQQQAVSASSTPTKTKAGSRSRAG
jgi:hypothetical protein